MELKSKKVLVTGGSAGIGKEIIRALHERGVQEIAVIGRKKEAMEKLREEFPSAKILVIEGDVSRIEDQERAITIIKREWGALDILVNNAGVVSAGLLSEISDDDIIQQISINLTGLILLTKKALPLLKESNEGAIMNISSGYGYIAMPFYSVYAASKAAVRQFSDALRREIFEFPIHVMTVYPSATNTNMMKSAEVDTMDDPGDVAKAAVEGLINGEINVLLGGEERQQQVNMNFNEPRKMDEVAQANYEALKKRTQNHRSM